MTPLPVPSHERPEQRSHTGLPAFQFDRTDPANIHELSGIPNRKALNQMLAHAVQDESLAGNFGLLFIDLNNMKEINDDEGGHSEGDAYLQNTAQVIQESLRGEDLVADHSLRSQTTPDDSTGSRFAAHLGGDEFVVLVAGVRTPEALDTIATRLHHNLDELGIPSAIGGQVHERGMDAAKLLREADMTMYEHKTRQIVEKLTPEQRESAQAIAHIALDAGLRLRDVPRILKALASAIKHYPS